MCFNLNKNQSINQSITNVITEKAVSKEEFEKTKSNVRVNKYENDKLEQYTRRENIRIFNLKCDPVKSLTESVIDMLNEMASHSVDTPHHVFKPEHINVCHRLGKPQGQGDVDSRAIIVRFISRQSVNMVFRHKKNLKLIDQYKGDRARDKKPVFISEDLTVLRVKLRDFLKDSDGVTDVYTRDGNIHVTKRGKKFTVCNPDDLFQLDIEPNFEKLGLEIYA